MAITARADSKFPNSQTGPFLHKMAPSIGVDLAVIEKAQDERAAARQKAMEKRIDELEKKIEKMSSKAAA